MLTEPPLLTEDDASTALPRRCAIELQNPGHAPDVGARRLRPWLTPVVHELAPRAGSLAVRFVSDREMRRLNRTFRGQDRPTDVLSFPGDQEPPDRHLGDIAIAVPTAKRQAVAGGHSVERELKVLLLHGLLHCLGYDHETDDGTMERLERRLRRRLIPSDPVR